MPGLAAIAMALMKAWAQRSYLLYDHCLQLLPQPALPKVPGSRRERMARRSRGRPVAEPQGEPTDTAVDPSKPACPCCGGRMIIIEVFERGTTPRHRPTGSTIVIRIDTS